MTATITPYRSGQQAGHDGFAQSLRAEWTKFRTMRGWVITMLAAAVATALAPIALAGTAKSNDPITCAHGQCQVETGYFATGPDGKAITVAMTQPRTVRNLVHSARRIRPNPSCSSGRRPGRGRAMVAVIALPPGRARDRPG